MKIKCIKSICEIGQKPGLVQAFYNKEGKMKSARIRHYLGMVSGKPKFSYCSQSVTYAEVQLNRVGQKALIESVASKAIAIGENHKIDQDGQSNGLIENNSNKINQADIKSGCSLAWFRTSACHVDDPGSNPGNRTKNFSDSANCFRGASMISLQFPAEFLVEL